jgi:16S rRNA (cytidine1402-2'-O)-methyltransferase
MHDYFTNLKYGCKTCQNYILFPPIGNLEDMTFRAIRILKEVDLILAEDTRTSGKLLKHFEIGTHMHSHHMHNEHKTVENLISRLKVEIPSL